jgi:uncharacterized protein YkwD
MSGRRVPSRLLAALLALGPACHGSDAGDTDATGTASTADTTADPTATDGAATTTATTDTTSSDTSGDAESPIWDTPYCHPVKDGPGWPPTLRDWEEEVVRLVNEARAAGADCDSQGVFAPTTPLTMNASLRCAARKHSKDMNDRNFFDHVNPDGEDPFDRIAQAGYGSYTQEGENIAGGPDSPKAAVDGWLESDGHCGNLMSPNYSEIGVGAYEGTGDYTFYWTQTFGHP